MQVFSKKLLTFDVYPYEEKFKSVFRKLLGHRVITSFVGMKIALFSLKNGRLTIPLMSVCTRVLRDSELSRV